MKYEKPKARDLGALSAAEGFCGMGGTASGSTCSAGPSDVSTCSAGGLAVDKPTAQFCSTGAAAANCFTGTVAGG